MGGQASLLSGQTAFSVGRHKPPCGTHLLPTRPGPRHLALGLRLTCHCPEDTLLRPPATGGPS